MKYWYIYIPITLMVGALLPLQGSINAYLSQYLKHPTQATVINFMGGLLFSVFISYFFVQQWPSMQEMKSIPWYLYFGGLLGVIGVTSYLLLIRQIGALNLMAGAIAGQIIFSILIDHYGWFGIPRHPISFNRILAIILLLSGVYFAQKN